MERLLLLPLANQLLEQLSVKAGDRPRHHRPVAARWPPPRLWRLCRVVLGRRGPGPQTSGPVDWVLLLLLLLAAYWRCRSQQQQQQQQQR